MPEIAFKKSRPAVQVAQGENLMQALLAAGLPVASSCNGDGICSKCKINIISGAENLSRENDTEIFLKEKNSIAKSYRISCQTEILGDIQVDATYW